MKLLIKKTLTYLTVFIYFGFATCQNGRNEDSFHNYDLPKLIQKSMDNIHTSQILKLISEESIHVINEFKKILPASIDSALLNGFSEASSSKCTDDLEYFIEQFNNNGTNSANLWAFKMLDSYGKPESGILTGNLKWLGRYDECIGVQAPSTKNHVGGFRGKYCSLKFPLKFGNASIPISVGVCLPDSCNPNGTVFSILDGSFPLSNETSESFFENATLTCKVTTKKLTTGAIAVICIISLFAFLVLIGSSITALEYFMKLRRSNNGNCISNVHSKELNSVDAENISRGYTDGVTLIGTNEKAVLPAWLENCKPFFNCFCIFANGEKILNTASPEGQLPCLHGIRFLSMTWVILCHTYASSSVIANNAGEAVSILDHWSFQIILNGFFSVDSFFVLSGFLVAYLYFQQAQKTGGKIPWLYFYIHRYIRLTPVYMIVVGFFATVSPFLGSGPLWPDYDTIQACKDNWWWNVLYINNFQSTAGQCMGWSWYLAVDMQFYVICPLFLITLWRWPTIGYSLIGLFFWIHFTSNFVLTNGYDLIAGIGNILESGMDIANMGPRSNDFFDKIYTKPYARIGSYLVGVVLAYYIFCRKRNNSPNLNWVSLSIGWIVASAITLACQFGLYHNDLTTVEASFYNALSRVGFSLGVGWVIFVCVIGQGGIVNSILSWKALLPLSRLTYCAYLVHQIVLTTYLTSVRTLITFSHINVIMLYLGFLVIIWAVALVTSLLLESPVIRLERLIRNKLASR